MNLQQFLSILWARRVIAVSIFAVIVSVTLVVSLLLPKSYKATTSLVLNFKGADLVTGLSLPSQLMFGSYIPTQVEIISSQKVALKVVDNLGFEKSPVVQQQFQDATKGEGDIRNWLAESLLKNLDVKPSRESNIVSISYEGNDPSFVALLANAFAEAYIQTALQLKVDPAKHAAIWFDGQVSGLRENLKNAQEKLSAYQQETGIVSVAEQLDVENARLNELSSQLVAAQTNSFDTASRQRQLANVSRMDEEPDIMNNTLIISIKEELSNAESKLADLGQRLDKNHPQYKSELALVENLRRKLDAELRNVGSSLGSSVKISQQRESELRSALKIQKARVLQLKEQRNQIVLLQRDVENAQRALDATTQRSSQTNLEGQSDQVDVAILNPAVAPLKPSKPRVMLNVFISIFLGTILAIALALQAEMMDRRVRVPEDLAGEFAMPVLGMLGKPKSVRKPWPWLLFLMRYKQAGA